MIFRVNASDHRNQRYETAIFNSSSEYYVTWLSDTLPEYLCIPIYRLYDHIVLLYWKSKK